MFIVKTEQRLSVPLVFYKNLFHLIISVTNGISCTKINKQTNKYSIFISQNEIYM